jgi:phosphatidylserine/phosphatidylglycerophosphate/cardiolipin synthase-like enzyme
LTQLRPKRATTLYLVVVSKGQLISKLVAVLAAVVVLVGGGGFTAQAYEPDTGALFNNPVGKREAQDRTMVHIRKAINNSPKHSLIRIATYSLDRPDITRALLDACERKVAIQLVLNDNWTSGQTRSMRRAFGTSLQPRFDDGCNPRDPEKFAQPWAYPSYVKICAGACRLERPMGNQHMKFFLFSQTGTARHVVMVGSTNLTDFAARTHWNDLFTIANRPVSYAAYSTIHNELAHDVPVVEPHVLVVDGDLTSEFGAIMPRMQKENDPVWLRLNQVSCDTSAGFGHKRHTIVRVMMYAWVGERGQYLAKKVADLDRAGCEVRVILSGAGTVVKRLLRRGGVAMRSADLDTDKDKDTGFDDTPWEHFTHEKWMTLNGTYAGSPIRVVWTGSENWSDKSEVNDEVTITIPRPKAHESYARHFEMLWRHHTRRL